MANQRRQVSFRPRARLVSMLGENLISDQAVGLLELVKNGYDADATIVTVELHNLANIEETEIVVRDNGFGMTLSDIVDKWLSPAVDHKDRAKKARNRTPLGRLPIGEKGVGRFAVHQLGKSLQLITRAADQPEVMLNIDWSAFDQGSQYLDELILEPIEREPEVFVGEETGTVLLIRESRMRWNDAQVRKVQRGLRRLQSPNRGHADFSVALVCPEFPDLQELGSSDILHNAHYTFAAIVDEDGLISYDYSCKLPGMKHRHAEDTDRDLIPQARPEMDGSKPTCGPFYLNLYVWDRSRDRLVASSVSREDLDAHCGVSVFRDGLRVLPYGERGNDWLALDQERIQDPSRRIGNDQVIGLVEVDQTANPDLLDKTNREGLIENASFRDLRALVRAAINEFRNQWLNDRPRSEARPRPQGNVEQVQNLATAIEKSSRDDIIVSVRHDLVKPALDELDGNQKEADEPIRETIQLPLGNGAAAGDSAVAISQRQAAQLLVKGISGISTRIKQDEQEAKHQQEILLGLAATGMAAERVVHEFGRQVSGALSALSRLRQFIRSEGTAASAADALDAALGALRNEFRILAPYSGLERAQRVASVSVLEACEIARTLNEQRCTALGIEIAVEGDDFSVRVRPASLVQVVDNLIDNACFWLQTSPTGERHIRITANPDACQILVEDTGPGVANHVRSQLFQPFFTTKNGGRGLGLYISRQLLDQVGAAIELVDSPSGASFQITFA